MKNIFRLLGGLGLGLSLALGCIWVLAVHQNPAAAAPGEAIPGLDRLSVEEDTAFMQVFYGTSDGVGGNYEPGHTFWITVTNSLGEIKATASVISAVDGGWWSRDGFMPTWAGPWGECCDWSPAEPDIQPLDMVFFKADDGYENQVRIGLIFGDINITADSITGPIFVPWLDQAMEVWCHPQSHFPPEYRQTSAEPDGSEPYFCEWQTVLPDLVTWDIQADSQVMVHYVEPDGDEVYRKMLAAEGAPVWKLYLSILVH